MIVRYRAVWALGMLAKHEESQAVREAVVNSVLEKLVNDTSEVEICDNQTNEIIYTTLGNLAKEALKYIQNDA